MHVVFIEKSTFYLISSLHGLMHIEPQPHHAPASPVAAYIADIKTLLYYDGPQLVEITDDIQQHYIGMAMPDDQMLLVQPSSCRLAEFHQGERDLRSLIKEAGEGRWFMADWPTGSQLIMHGHEGPLTNEALLPDPGLFIRSTPPPQEA